MTSSRPRTPNSIICLIALIALSATPRPAPAIPPFWQQFQAKYVKPQSDDATVKKFAQAALAPETGKCLICHVSGKPKSVRNVYGAALAKRLSKDDFTKSRLDAEPEKAKQEIDNALDQVAEQPVDPTSNDSPTFSQRIAQGLLPGAEPKQAPAAKKTAAAAAQPKPQPPAPQAKQEATTAPADAGSGQLAALLLQQLKSELAAQLKAELAPKLREELRAELGAKLKSELKVQLKDSIRAVVLAELRSPGNVPEDVEAKAIQKIRKLGGTVMQLAQNDDSKTVSFHLSGADLTDDGLLHLQAVNKLVHLNLKGTHITDAGLAQIANLTTLTRLNLARTQVSDAGLRQLMGLDHLVYLNLYGTQVTDAGLKYLTGMTNLRKLFLWQSNVTEEGARWLQQQLPDCEVND